MLHLIFKAFLISLLLLFSACNDQESVFTDEIVQTNTTTTEAEDETETQLDTQSEQDNEPDIEPESEPQTDPEPEAEDEVVPSIENFTASIDENIAIGSVVGSVDINSSGSSSITSFTLSDTTEFNISDSGEVTTKVELDFETQNQYTLSVYATNNSGDSESKSIEININDIYEAQVISVPTLVVIMNWNDYSENDPKIWHDKIFNSDEKSVNKWYGETTDGEIELVPVDESSGTHNDGVIIVDMGKDHPGGSDNTDFRDTEITNAITDAEVEDNVDFAALDVVDNGDDSLDRNEIQIIFIVAGGEESYGDNVAHSVWAHAWSFASDSTLAVDGKKVMRYTGDDTTSGSYARFGANHGDHKATIGIIAHELGHSMLALADYYDNGGGSGLGWYDIMSGGSWGYRSGEEQGATPTQFSAYNRIDANLDLDLTEVDTSQEITIKCGSRELIKLVTGEDTEYFLIECRDTAKENSDISFDLADSSFTDNKLFMMMYHVDTDKSNNHEDGVQTDGNHYNVALVEKETSELMTSTENIRADYDDVYTLGDVIASSETELYDGTVTDYAIEVIDEDYDNRTMTISITK